MGNLGSLPYATEQSMWFEALTGFPEESPEQVRSKTAVEGDKLISHVNGKRYFCGTLETPCLTQLREIVEEVTLTPGNISVREIVANVQDLHIDPKSADALFQVASQFNLLEMVSPNVTPERGVGIYENDRTQGPACAIAAGAGTIYRNYFVNIDGQVGQSESNQVDCLADLGIALGNSDNRLWEMRNGYALATNEGLAEISDRLQAATESERDGLRKLLRIGIHWDTQVTLNDSLHKVSQAYCSALPVAYSSHPSYLWEEFATLVLEASYEATFCAAIMNSERTGNNTLFLTLLGGGAFGNITEWIVGAIQRSIELYKDRDLDVAIVSYGSSEKCIQHLLT
jgi:hypothetical protein